MSDDKWIVEGDKPKVEAARKYFTEFRASLQNARDVERDLRVELERLQTVENLAKDVARAFTAESEDWNDGTYALWRKDDLVNAIVKLRAALPDSYGCKRP